MTLELADDYGLRDNVIVLEDEVLKLDMFDSFEIYWDLHELYIHGSFVFRDEGNIFEKKKITTGAKLHLYGKDLIDKEMNQDFILTDVSEIRSQSPTYKTHVVRFMDPAMYSIMKIYKAKGFPENKKIQDIFMEYYKSLDNKKWKERFTQKEVKWMIKKDLTLKNPYIVPADRSLMVILHRILSENDILFFSRRNDYTAIEHKVLLTQKPRAEIFEFMPTNTKYTYRIGDITNNSAKGTSTGTILPNAKEFSYDHNAKKANISKLTHQQITSEGKLGKTESNINEIQEGDKILYNSHGNSTYTDMYRRYTNKMFEIEITVPGTFNNQVGDMVEVNIPTNNFGDTNIDKNISGKYLITKVTDKFVQAYFVQRLTLSRSTFK